jgi:hypothetical protein
VEVEPLELLNCEKKKTQSKKERRGKGEQYGTAARGGGKPHEQVVSLLPRDMEKLLSQL